MIPMSDVPLNLAEYAQLAETRLPRMVFDDYAGGADDELTVRENELAWRRLSLRPRILVDVSRRDLSTTVLGQPISMPILTAPCGFNALAHPDGELAVARGVTACGTVQVVSTAATYSLEEVAATAPEGLRWFQLDEVLGLDQMDAGGDGSALKKYIESIWDAGLTWEAVDWLRSISPLPVVLKGVLTAEDARLAVAHGVAGVVVSNHGGRQLDGAMATADALPEIADAVGDALEIYVDGGIRRGGDVLKALALGTRAVLIGRPYLWGLAVDGEAGVRRVLELLRGELDLSLALSGHTVARNVPRSLLGGHL